MNAGLNGLPASLIANQGRRKMIEDLKEMLGGLALIVRMCKEFVIHSHIHQLH